MDDTREPRSDASLLAAHVAGDGEAFGLLFSRHRDRLYAVALRTAGDPELAADALQEGMVAAFRRAGTFRGEAAVTTWLHRIVVNATLDLHRRNAARPAEPLTDAVTEPLEAPSASDPESALVQDETRRSLLEALRRLPVDQRAAVVLVDVEGWSVADAAAVLDCPVGTVKSRCSRGRARLAGMLRPGNPEGATHVPPSSDVPPGDRPGSARTPSREEGSP